MEFMLALLETFAEQKLNEFNSYMLKKYADHVRQEEQKFTVISLCMDELDEINIPENHTAVAGSDKERTITDLSD